MLNVCKHTHIFALKIEKRVKIQGLFQVYKIFQSNKNFIRLELSWIDYCVSMKTIQSVY